MQMYAANNSLPCTLCTQPLEQRADKNGKPYFVCDECGTQFFVRGARGKERLLALLSRAKSITSETSSSSKETKALIGDLDSLQGFIEAFDGGEEIILSGSGEIEDSVLFVDWSRQLCERIVNVLKRK
jgi:hypothetical protein